MPWFCWARELTGVNQNGDVHSTVQGKLKHIQGFTPVSQLGDLERLRSMADYDLLPNNPLDQDWERHWERPELLAEDIVSKLDASQPN